MKKDKLTLEQIKVKSFMTSLNPDQEIQILGGKKSSTDDPEDPGDPDQLGDPGDPD